MTVRLNGVTVHQNVELTKLTPGPLLKDDASLASGDAARLARLARAGGVTP